MTAALAEGFLHGDYAAWLIPDMQERRAAYARYFDIFARHFLEYGVVDVTAEFEGVALWWRVHDKVDLGIDDYDRRLEAAVGPAAQRFRNLDAAMDRAHPHHRPHWYLLFLAVHPDCQEQGHGRSLLTHRLHEIDGEGLPAYLEATGERNQNLYERFAFRPLPPVNIPLGPLLRPMWRQGSIG